MRFPALPLLPLPSASEHEERQENCPALGHLGSAQGAGSGRLQPWRSGPAPGAQRNSEGSPGDLSACSNTVTLTCPTPPHTQRVLHGVAELLGLCPRGHGERTLRNDHRGPACAPLSGDCLLMSLLPLSSLPGPLPAPSLAGKKESTWTAGHFISTTVSGTRSPGVGCGGTIHFLAWKMGARLCIQAAGEAPRLCPRRAPGPPLCFRAAC